MLPVVSSKYCKSLLTTLSFLMTIDPLSFLCKEWNTRVLIMLYYSTKGQYLYLVAWLTEVVQITWFKVYHHVRFILLKKTHGLSYHLWTMPDKVSAFAFSMRNIFSRLVEKFLMKLHLWNLLTTRSLILSVKLRFLILREVVGKLSIT